MKDINKKSSSLFFWCLRGAVYTLPGNIITWSVFILMIRAVSLIETRSVLWEFKLIVFGIPCLLYLGLGIYSKAIKTRQYFWYGASVAQIILFFLVWPNFKM